MISYFNFITNLFFIYWFFINPNFFISIDRTFWGKKIKSITLMIVISDTKYGRSSKGLFTILLGNVKKMDEEDSRTLTESKKKK